MRNLHDPLRKKISENILAALQKMGCEPLPSINELVLQLVEPPTSAMGDLAFGCFILAKNLKKSPAIMAQELKKELETLGSLKDQVETMTAAGPYLNFALKPEWIGQQILDPILNGSFFKTELTSQNPKTMIEYSQPNTHKELHVGHMRNACLGDALVRMGRYAGLDIVSATFPGDVGTHVAKCLWYLKYKNTETIPATGKGEWLGRIYSKANLMLEDELGSPKEADNREKLTMILKQLEAKSGEFYDLWKETNPFARR